MKLHKDDNRPNRYGGTNYRTLCGRMSSESKDGMNVAPDDEGVTCKLCLNRMKYSKPTRRPMVDLIAAKPGDRFEARDGDKWEYDRPDGSRHWLRDSVGREFWFWRNGVFGVIGPESDHTLIRALDAPAPAEPEQGDAGYSGEFGQAANDADLLAWLKREHDRLVAQFPDIEYVAGSDDTIFSVAGTRIEALLLRATKAEAALEEARKELTDVAAHLIGAASAYRKYAARHRSVGRAKADPFFTIRADDFDRAADRASRAARGACDWHAKDGSGDPL